MSKEPQEAVSGEQWLAEQGFDLTVLSAPAPTTPAKLQQEGFKVDPNAYDRVCIAFSGGKDSLALLLHVLELGVPREKIELHHHLVDGREGSTLMDWPITESYCEAIAHQRAIAAPIRIATPRPTGPRHGKTAHNSSPS